MMDLDEKRKKDRANERFDREEMGALLRLFSALGFTVAAGILGFFLLGIYIDNKLTAWGYETYRIPRYILLLLGLTMTIYWAYLRIARHLDRYGGKEEK